MGSARLAEIRTPPATVDTHLEAAEDATVLAEGAAEGARNRYAGHTGGTVTIARGRLTGGSVTR